MYHVTISFFFTLSSFDILHWGKKLSAKPVSPPISHTSRSSIYVQGKYTSSARFLRLHPRHVVRLLPERSSLKPLCVRASLFSQRFYRRKKMFFQAKLVQLVLSVLKKKNSNTLQVQNLWRISGRSSEVLGRH